MTNAKIIFFLGDRIFFRDFLSEDSDGTQTRTKEGNKNLTSSHLLRAWG